MSNEFNVIRPDDPSIWDRIWERAQRKAREREAWEASPDAWHFDAPVTWEAIANRDPRLNSLASYAVAVGRRDTTYNAWYRDIKPRLERLVGHLADDQPPPFWTSDVYDVAYQHLLRLYEVAK